ncbi:MAG: flippase-like domain-containing protein [Chloroflexota bacterium]|nr:flippase-like domain-containing protein [Chloroflexota bacterium]
MVLIAAELAITSGALVLLFRGVDMPETARAFRKANYWLLVPAIVFLILDLQFRAVRWRLLLSPHPGLRHSNLFGATNVGYLVNDVLPFRAGEVARVFLIDELEKTGKVRSAASIAVERGIDVIAMIALVIALFPFIDEPGWTHGPALLIGGGAVAAFALVIGLSHVNETDRAFWKAWLRRVPRIGEQLELASNAMLIALHPLRRIATLGSVVVLTAVIWTCGTLSFLMIMKAFHLDVGFPAAAIVIGATTLGMVVPSSPGYVGVFHAIAVKTLTEVFGVPKENALTYAFAQHAVIYFVPAGLGAAFLWNHRPMWHDFAASIGVRARRPTAAVGATAGNQAPVPEPIER